MNRIVKTFIASVVSEIQQSDIYLTVKARLFETPGANLNGVRVTPAFLAEIVDNQEKYVGLPLCADVKSLAAGNYQHLGHLYDARTGEFHSAQIGSFYQYEKEETADGAALIGYVRIMKRNKAVCRAISELFADNALKFSFEISCGSYRKLDDGTIEIDASKDNYLEGAAVVTFPACESAVALDLVAECKTIADGNREGENKMTDNIDTSAVIAEENIDQPELVVAEDVRGETAIAESDDASKATEVISEAEIPETSEEIAEVVIVEHHVNVDDVNVYDTDTGASMEEHIVHEVKAVTPMSDVVNEFAPTDVAVVEVAESEPEEKPEEDEDEQEEATAEVVAEDAAEQIRAIVAELRAELESIKAELAELKNKPEQIIAEAVTAQANNAMNPFIAEPQRSTRYSLLEKDERPERYSLLDRA